MQSIISRQQFEVIALEGHLNASIAAELRQNLTSKIAATTSPLILVDMAKVESMDSAGLMALVSTLRLSQTLDRQMSLCAISPSVRIILELTQLDRVFRIFKNQEECETFFSSTAA